MNNHVKSAQVNILGLLEGTIDFQPGLNILSGENGTLKTKLLQAIKSANQVTPSSPGSPLRMQAISPKRNSERRNIETILQALRSQNQTIDSFIARRLEAQINDRSFEPYPSLGDLFYALYEKLCKDGGNQREKMEVVTSEFNDVITSIFDEYRLLAQWNEVSGTPRISLRKNGINDVPLEDLSLGEQEILSLVTNLYTSKDSLEVFLIDEPEIHLNWHLEERLFEYFDKFCSSYGKQMIVATHSRAIFREKFLKKTQFLYWNEKSTISVGHEISDEQRRRIAGEAIDIIRLGDFSQTTFFVEDFAHRQALEAMAQVIGSKLLISECGNSSNVRSLFKHSKNEGGWERAVFLTDGDNEGNPFPGENRFVRLEKYCIENYFLDFDTASSVTSKSQDEIRQALLESVLENRRKILNKNKYFDFLFDRLALSDVQPTFLDKLDASVIFESYLAKIGMGRADYVRLYVAQCHKEAKLDSILSKQLVEHVQEAGK